MSVVRLPWCRSALACMFLSIPHVVFGQTDANLERVERAILDRLAEIESAARELNPDKVYQFVLENDRGSLIQDGQFFRTRDEALQVTRRGFRNIQKVDYQFSQQHIVLLSPTVALATGAGQSTATTNQGQEISTRFAQSVILVQSDGQWRVLHAHRSFPPSTPQGADGNGR